MIVERLVPDVAVICDRCRRAEVPGWTATLHEADRGQSVYSIRLNLTLSICYACTPKEPAQP
jgi:hypothetical protein